MELLTPKMRFRLNRLQRRWEEWKASLRRTGQEVLTEQKMCPACRALVPRNSRRCPFCGESQHRVSPNALGRVLPPDVPLTHLLIGVNFLVFIVECLLNRSVPIGLIGPGMKGWVLLRLGMSVPMAYLTHPSPVQGQYWRWVTALFLHDGILHIGFNMWVLADVGPLVEGLYGRGKFLALYLAAGIIGNAFAGIFSSASVVGASGAIMGLIGVLIAYGVRHKTAMAQHMRAQAIRFAVYVLIMGLLPGISDAAHIGGIGGGFLLALMIGDDPPLTETQIRFWRAAQWAVAGVVLASFILMARTHVSM